MFIQQRQDVKGGTPLVAALPDAGLSVRDLSEVRVTAKAARLDW